MTMARVAELVWSTIVGAEDCDWGPAPCSMCLTLISGLHIHVIPDFGTPLILGFCSEECAGRWSAGEPLAAERITT